ncbi:His-Xaa-Ser system protein HxsD [Fusobacterium varium]|uniref:His-Xaa-Ser system protein HxsD n=1 Tax=Fusobacterium varium TaxID=856 RepID=UPI0035656C07
MKKELIFKKNIYTLSSAMKTAYNYIDEAYIFFKEIDENTYMMEVETKDSNLDLETLIRNLKNELLHEKIRETISVESKSIRELILARALYGLALENGKNETPSFEGTAISSNENINESYLDDKENIGEGWFK